jgi:hypothetical protein
VSCAAVALLGVQINLYMSLEKPPHPWKAFTARHCARKVARLHYALLAQVTGFPMSQPPAPGTLVADLVRGRLVTGRVVRQDLGNKFKPTAPAENNVQGGTGDVVIDAA